MSSPCSRAHIPEPCKPVGVSGRTLENYARRYNAARKWAVPPPNHPNNGDLTSLADRCGSYSKGVKQDSPGKVNLAEFGKLQVAIANGSFSDFNNVQLGNMGNPAGRLNGPMSAYAYAFVGPDSAHYTSHPLLPPKLTSKDYATELVELYWCSLLRDVAFLDYAVNPVAQAAAADLSLLHAHYKGPTDAGTVTPELLFRGDYPEERIGPYLSQFLVLKTTFGAAPFEQKYTTYQAGLDYMTDENTWFQVQQGQATGLANQTVAAPVYLHDGRGMAAYTHVDELYQAYFTAHLVLEKLNIPNPANPYNTAVSQKPFGTLGAPDVAAVLGQVAKYAICCVWYQKWAVHLRHRPEAGAGLVHWKKTHGTNFSGWPDLSILDASPVLGRTHDKYGTFLLSQPFPEGSPTHPAYPTGHGAVGGACITVLKFFYDGGHVLEAPKMPTSDGTALEDWTGQAGAGAPGDLTVNGELHKLAHNVTFAHGLHGGIHWRSDSDASVRLGEACAIDFLEDLVCTYAEPLTVKITKLDGTTHSFTNV